MSREKTKTRAIICICGMAGSGKSTLAKKLARRYGLKYYSGGDALKTMALEEGYASRKRGWWESEEGIRFLKERNDKPEFDKKVDAKLLKLAQQGNVILDSWTMPWLLKEGLKIWLEASPEKRAERIAKRNKISYEESLDALRAKEKQTKAIYKELYGFDLGEDLMPFKLVLDTEALGADEVFQVLCTVIDGLVHKRA
jgi:cytidylate kinase